MVERHKIDVIVTTDDKVERSDVKEYADRVLRTLEETDFIHRTYVESDGMKDADGERMIEMIARIEDENLADAADALDRVTKDNS
jgi:hypothetical protein